MKFVIFAFFVLISAAAAFAQESPVGYWESISDLAKDKGKVTGVWEFKELDSGELQATLVWAPKATDATRYRCLKPQFNGLPILHHVWLRGLKPAGSNFWSGGTIVDVGNDRGDVYGCEIRLREDGQRLELRGYIGISLFGRTQVWKRTNAEELAWLRSTQQSLP